MRPFYFYIFNVLVLLCGHCWGRENKARENGWHLPACCIRNGREFYDHFQYDRSITAVVVVGGMSSSLVRMRTFSDSGRCLGCNVAILAKYEDFVP